jgi:hypothetical protein
MIHIGGRGVALAAQPREAVPGRWVDWRTRAVGLDPRRSSIGERAKHFTAPALKQHDQPSAGPMARGQQTIAPTANVNRCSARRPFLENAALAASQKAPDPAAYSGAAIERLRLYA